MTIMQIKSPSKPKSRFVIASFLFCLVFFLFSLPASSQVSSEDSSGQTEKKLDVIGRPVIEYGANDFRDPFYPQVFIPEKEEPKVEKVEVAGPKATELFSLLIQGIIWNSDNPLAIINNQVLKKGEALLMPKEADARGEITIMEIDKDGVTIMYAGQVEKLPSPATLELRRMNLTP